MGKIGTYQLPAHTLSQFTKTRISEEHPEIQTLPSIVEVVIEVSRANLEFYTHPASFPLQENKMFQILCFNS